MKKVGCFIKKNKKRVIVVAVLIIVLPLIGLVLQRGLWYGFIPVPKPVMLWYFDNNREDFDYIAEYIEEHPETELAWLDAGYEEEIMAVEDEKLRDSIAKVLKRELLCCICYLPDDNGNNIEIEFMFSYNTRRKGDGSAFVYSTKYLVDYRDYYSDDVVYGYEPIDGNWYYEYRVR